MVAGIFHLLHIPYNWLTKILLVTIVIALWQVNVGPNQAAFETTIIYWENLIIFPFMPESVMIKIEQLLILTLTIKLTLWLMKKDTYGLPSHASSGSGFSTKETGLYGTHP